MKIAIRVDGNRRLGMGHVNRCKILAINLNKIEVSCIFLTQYLQVYENLSSEGFIAFLIGKKNESQQVNDILRKEHCSKLVIDSKKKSVGKLITNLDKKIKIIMIDNSSYSNYVDLFVFSSLKDPKKKYPHNSIVGAQYVLHGINKQSEPIRKKNNSILVSMGGSDKYNITQKIIKSFLKSSILFDLTVVLGKYYENDKQLLKIIDNDKRFHIVKNPSSLTRLMNKSTIGVTTFGITVYESAICGLPLFVISHSNENDDSAKLVAKYGWISYVGKYDQINYDKVVKNVLDLMTDKKELKNMKQSCLQIDGLGPFRIAESIKKL